MEKKRILIILCLLAVIALLAGCVQNGTNDVADGKSDEPSYRIIEDSGSSFILIQVTDSRPDNSLALHQGLQELERRGYDIVDWKPNAGTANGDQRSNPTASYEVRVKR
ncbi:MAG: hypothetical protein WC788_07185 [Candidatus Paceibacterota bacterium]|jgi:hypothetical protein